MTSTSQTKSKSFTLTLDEIDIIEKTLTIHRQTHDRYTAGASASDVVRVGLHLVDMLSREKRIQLLNKHRGRSK